MYFKAFWFLRDLIENVWSRAFLDRHQSEIKRCLALIDSRKPEGAEVLRYFEGKKQGELFD